MSDFWDAPTLTRARLVSLDDSGPHQKATFTGHKNERFSDVLRMQAHGFASNPPPGSYGYLLRMGSSDRAFVIGMENDGRVKNLPPGASALYDANGNVVSIVQQNIRIASATEVRIVAPKIVLESGDVHLGGEGGLPVERQTDDPSTKVKAL